MKRGGDVAGVRVRGEPQGESWGVSRSAGRGSLREEPCPRVGRGLQGAERLRSLSKSTQPAPAHTKPGALLCPPLAPAPEKAGVRVGSRAQEGGRTSGTRASGVTRSLFSVLSPAWWAVKGIPEPLPTSWPESPRSPGVQLGSSDQPPLAGGGLGPTGSGPLTQSAVLLDGREGQKMHLQIQVSTHNQVLTEEGRGNQIELVTSNRIGSFEPVQTTCWNLASQPDSCLLRGGLSWGGGAAVSGAHC